MYSFDYSVACGRIDFFHHQICAAKDQSSGNKMLVSQIFNRKGTLIMI